MPGTFRIKSITKEEFIKRYRPELGERTSGLWNLFQVIPDAFYAAGYKNMGFMVLAPGAFIAIGLIVWLQKTVSKE